jgi:hypothetical protein
VGPRLSAAIIWSVAAVTASSATYETWALVTRHITISRYLRNLAESYHPVYVFAGILVCLLFLIALVGNHLPLSIRLFVLVWLFVFGHIFWGLC